MNKASSNIDERTVGASLTLVAWVPSTEAEDSVGKDHQIPGTGVADPADTARAQNASVSIEAISALYGWQPSCR